MHFFQALCLTQMFHSKEDFKRLSHHLGQSVFLFIKLRVSKKKIISAQTSTLHLIYQIVYTLYEGIKQNNKLIRQY